VPLSVPGTIYFKNFKSSVPNPSNFVPATNVVLTNFMTFNSYLNVNNLQKLATLSGPTISSGAASALTSQLAINTYSLLGGNGQLTISVDGISNTTQPVSRLGFRNNNSL